MVEEKIKIQEPFRTNTFCNYKITFPKTKKRIESIFNLGEKFKVIGGQVSICLWFSK